MADFVEIKTGDLTELLDRLTERRSAVDKEVRLLGEPPSSLKEVFELCRGFEAAFVSLLNSKESILEAKRNVPVSAKIKECFISEKGLAGQIKDLPLEKTFKIENVKRVCKQADGYQPHLVAPEKGLRLLAAEALTMVQPAVQSTVFEVYKLLILTAQEAADKAGQYTEQALSGKEPMHVPAFKGIVMPAVTKCMDDWRQEAEKLALMLVDMERSYITAGFFRHMVNRRNTKATRGMGGGPVGGPKEKATRMDKIKNLLPGRGGAGRGDDDYYEPQPIASTAPPPAAGSSLNLNSLSDPSEFIAGYFEKQVADDSKNILKSKWQKRFFIFQEPQKTLYYFKSAEDVRKENGLKGSIYVGDCVIEDLDERGNVSPTPSMTSTMFRIRHKDPTKSAVKDHNAVVLRADKLQQKAEWIQRLRRCTDTSPPTQDRRTAFRVSDNGDVRNSTSSFRGGGDDDDDEELETQPTENSSNAVDDIDDMLDANPNTGTRLGQGAALFRAETMRDPEGRLLPAPQMILEPTKNTGKPETYEQRYDRILEAFGEDMGVYARMVCDTIVTTVPKAIIHALVRTAEKNLLSRIFAYVHNLGPNDQARLMEEDTNIIKRRAAAKLAQEEIGKSILDVQSIQEKVSMASNENHKPTCPVAAKYLAYAGMQNLMDRALRSKYDPLINSPFAPKALREELAVEKKWSEQKAAAAAESQASQARRRPPPSVPGGPPGSMPPGARSGPGGPDPRMMPPGKPGLVQRMPSGTNGAPMRRAPPPPPQ